MSPVSRRTLIAWRARCRLRRRHPPGAGRLHRPADGHGHRPRGPRTRKLWAAANGRAKPRERDSNSGLWLERLPGARATVAVVSRTSPAADAGLKVGDVLTGVAWPRLLRQLGGPPGAVVAVTVDGGAPRTLTLRAFL